MAREKRDSDDDLSPLGLPEPTLEPPDGSPAQTDPALAGSRRKLLDQSGAHVPAVKGFMSATENFYSIDIFMVGVANRSVYLIRGFVDALDKWNIFAAAPLVRLQVDSLIKVSYMTWAPSASVVADEVVKGRSFRSLRDSAGQKLTDRRLVELATPHHPWLKQIYSSGNEWIHLSSAQVLSPWEYSKGDPVGQLSLYFPMRRAGIPREFLRNMVDAMSEATDDLLTSIDLWRQRKGLPPGQARP